MSANEPLSLKEIMKILFQEPDRVTKGLATDLYDDDDRSLARAIDELADCECLNDVHLSQIMTTYRKVSMDVFEEYLDEQLNKASGGPEDVFWFMQYEAIYDVREFLGLAAIFEDSSGAMKVAEGNPVAQRIRERVERKLEFFFPPPVYLRPDANGQSLG